MRRKSVQGFQTGDQVYAQVAKGRHKGFYKGRVAIRANGYFNIQTQEEVIQGISHKYCRVIWRADGYHYSQTPKIVEKRKESEKKEHASHAALSLLGQKVKVSRAF